MFLSENLKSLRSRSQLSQELLSNALGIKRSTYKDYESGINEPGIAMLLKFSSYYKTSIDALVNTKIDETDFGQSDIGNNLKVLAITVDVQQKENIELVPVKAQAGYLNSFSDPVYISSLSRFQLPNLPIGTYRAFEIEGDSMPPVVNKSLVIARYVEHWRDVKNLSTYVFITKSGLVYKRVINKVKQKGIFIMLSDNAYYEPYVLAADEVLEMWSYHAHFSFGYDKPDYAALINKLNDLEEVTDLKQLLQKKIIQ